MGPRTVEPVAGAVAWALARWATLREAQPVRPKQADLVTVGQDWSLVPHTHAHTSSSGESTLSCLTVAGWIHSVVCVCFFTCAACQMFSLVFKPEKSGSLSVSHI